MGIHSEAKLNRKFMEFAKLMNIYLNHFPKHEKFALANRIRSTAYGNIVFINSGNPFARSIRNPPFPFLGTQSKRIRSATC